MLLSQYIYKKKLSCSMLSLFVFTLLILQQSYYLHFIDEETRGHRAGPLLKVTQLSVVEPGAKAKFMHLQSCAQITPPSYNTDTPPGDGHTLMMRNRWRDSTSKLHCPAKADWFHSLVAAQGHGPLSLLLFRVTEDWWIESLLKNLLSLQPQGQQFNHLLFQFLL